MVMDLASSRQLVCLHAVLPNVCCFQSLLVAVVISTPVAGNSQQRTALPILTSADRVSGWGYQPNHPTLARQKVRVKARTGVFSP